MSIRIGTPTINSFPGFSQAPWGVFSRMDLIYMLQVESFNRIYRYTLTTAYTSSTATVNLHFTG
jgi:hypothetical protein